MRTIYELSYENGVTLGSRFFTSWEKLKSFVAANSAGKEFGVISIRTSKEDEDLWPFWDTSKVLAGSFGLL